MAGKTSCRVSMAGMAHVKQEYTKARCRVQTEIDEISGEQNYEINAKKKNK